MRVHTKIRTDKKDFIASIRECLEQKFPDKLIGLGGTFLLKEGKAKQHVMRDFSKTPLNNEDDLNNWLKFYNMSAPLVAVGTLINGDGVRKKISIMLNLKMNKKIFSIFMNFRVWTYVFNISIALVTMVKQDITTLMLLLKL